MKNFSKFYLFFLILSGCQVGPKYKKIETPVVSNWKGPIQHEQGRSNLDCWWEIFEDETLNQLEEKLLQKNYDLYIALQKVVESKAAAGIEKSKLYPQANINGNYNYFQEYLKLRQKGKTKNPYLNEKITVYGQEYTFPNLLSYEIDLFGKLRSQYQAATLSYEASEEDLKSTHLSLTTQLASYYFNLCALDSQLDLIASLIEIAKEKESLEKIRYEKGLTSQLNYISSSQALYKLYASQGEVERQRTFFENAIATLIGSPASNFTLGTKYLSKKAPPAISPSLPSSILLQRPDIGFFEKMAASKHALVKAAYVSFFPSFDLTSGLGYTSLQLKDFLNIKGFLWQIGASVVQSVFDAGKKKSNLNASWARFRQAEAGYKLAVIKAFEEVENALSALEKQDLKVLDLSSVYQLSLKANTLARGRFEKGLTNKIVYLESKEAAIYSEQSLIGARTLQYQATINMIKSLGGRWGAKNSEKSP
jgi:multidrug efflux system outer membrane protein